MPSTRAGGPPRRAQSRENHVVAHDCGGDRGRIDDVALYDAQVGVLGCDRLRSAYERCHRMSLGQRLRDYLLTGTAGGAEND